MAHEESSELGQLPVFYPIFDCEDSFWIRVHNTGSNKTKSVGNS